MEKLYTLSVFTENRIGILSRICCIFTRRHLNIESITASESEIKEVYRYTILLKTSEAQVRKVIGQIERLIDVLKAFVHEDSDTVYQEIALYKIDTAGLGQGSLEKVIRNNHARILMVHQDFLVIEKTGHEADTQQLFEALKPYGILEFARSGRVSITKPMKELSAYLEELDCTTEVGVV